MTAEDIRNAEEIAKALHPMLVATSSMCEEKSLTVSIISTIEDAPLIKDIKRAIHEDLAKRYMSADEKNCLYVASAMGPRFKSMLFLAPSEVQETYAMVVSKATALMVIITCKH